ncbi:MAG TPA: family 78 glycoside hydrolase catalytic domain [Pedococcus sp.]|nr:family 78 glycoside hydrolase catalytic domain [Pedococcus sp.]
MVDSTGVDTPDLLLACAAPTRVWVDLVGGDSFGTGDQPALSWWLPPDAAVQLAYRILTDDGYDSGRVDSPTQAFVTVPVFDAPRRRTTARVTVWTELGQSPWSDPVTLDSGLLDEAAWSAAWVGPHEPTRAAKGNRPATWVRQEFTVDPGVHTDPVLHVTALGLYEVWLNGTRVGDQELTPGFTQYRERVQYQSYDVRDLVVEGRNVVAVLLSDGWFRGQVGLPRAADQFGSDLSVRVQLEARSADGVVVLAATDEEWRSGPSHVLAADLIGGQQEDRRLVDLEAHRPGARLDGWARVVPREVLATIVRSIAPPVRRVEELAPVAMNSVGDATVVDLGQNVNGWLRLRDLGPAGTRTTLRHGEHLDGHGDLTTAHLDVNVPIIPDPLPVGQVDLVTSAGRDGDSFEPRLTTHGFRYARVEGSEHAAVAAGARGVVVHSDLRRTGWFECSDPRLTRLHEVTVWSLRDNLCDIPTDCPQRERSGWTGDWQIFAPTAAYLYDVLAFTRKWLRDVALDQRADGCVANISPCPPAEGFGGPLAHVNGSAGWGDVVVSAPWDLYQAYGDEHLLRESWRSLRSWLRYAAKRAATERHPSREETRTTPAPHEKYLWDSGFHWGEWLEPDADLSDFAAFVAADKAEVATAYLHRSASTAAQIGRIIGVPEAEVAALDELAAGSKAAWQTEFVGTDGTLTEQTQASHVRALAFDLVESEHRPAVAQRLVELIRGAGTHLGTGFLSTPMLLPVLADAGHLEVAYELLLQNTEPSWLTMLDRGATTVWERWNGVDADGQAHESLNHYSKGAVVTFLHRYVAGLVPTSPGYRTFRVRPQPGGGLTSARATLDCPFGPIEVSWAIHEVIEGDSFSLDVSVPGGTTAEVVLPSGQVHEVGPGRHRW